MANISKLTAWYFEPSGSNITITSKYAGTYYIDILAGNNDTDFCQKYVGIKLSSGTSSYYQLINANGTTVSLSVSGHPLFFVEDKGGVDGLRNGLWYDTIIAGKGGYGQWNPVVYNSDYGNPPIPYWPGNPPAGYLPADRIPTLTASGHTFYGWYYNGELVTTGTYFERQMYVAHNIYARWDSKPQIELSYSTSHGTAPASKTVANPYTLTAEDLPTLTDQDYNFGGRSNNGSLALVGDTVYDDTVLTAIWTPKPTATVTYQTAHGSKAPRTDYTPFTLTDTDLPILEDDDYVMSGWYLNGTKIEAGYTVTENITLVAEWVARPDPATITYQTEYGSVPSQTKWVGYELTADDLPTLSQPRYSFGGWYIGTTKIEPGYVLTGDTTLVAKWTAIEYHFIRYRSQFDKPNDKEVEVPYYIQAEDIPIYEIEGYKHVGWLIDGEKVEIGYEVTEDVTLIGQFIKQYVPPKLNFNGNRRNEKYTYRRVEFGSFNEMEDYNLITKGSIEMSEEADLKVTGSFSFEGYELPNTNDLLRVYYSFEDDNGVKFNEPVATLFVNYARLSHLDTLTGIRSSGTLDGLSVLKVLNERRTGLPYSVPKNANPIYVASDLIRECGLKVDLTPTSYVMSKSYTFEAGATYLEICNELMNFASYRGLYPDEYGTVQLRPIGYEGETVRFRNDDKSIMYPEISNENNLNEIPNKVCLLYNVTDGCIYAEATNLSGSRSSLDVRKREVTSFEEVSDLNANGSKPNAMRSLAEQRLLTLSADIELVTFDHAFVPLRLYDQVEIDYGDMNWNGNVTDININLEASTKCETRIKKTLSSDIEVESYAKVVR